MPAAAQVTGRAAPFISAGVHRLAGVSSETFTSWVDALPPGIVVIPESTVSASALAPLLRLGSQPGFVVEDLTDLAEFVPIDGVDVPTAPLYALQDVQRGDDLRNISPNEALPTVQAAGRSPLTISEGISWLLQEPDQMVPNHCFMTIASRRRTARGLDARTPAIWISGGTGRDGRARKGAPKVGWCWAGNRHTWLGIASTSGRSGPQ